MELNEVYKQNLIKIVEEHKLNCEDEHCNISVLMLLDLGIKAGLTFTDEEKLKFM